MAIVSDGQADRIDVWNNIKAVFFIAFLVILFLVGMKGWNALQTFMDKF